MKKKIKFILKLIFFYTFYNFLIMANFFSHLALSVMKITKLKYSFVQILVHKFDTIKLINNICMKQILCTLLSDLSVELFLQDLSCIIITMRM